jgi:hypothetical protein
MPLLELPPWYDVDDRRALRRLLEELSMPPGGEGGPFAAPATASCVARLGLAAVVDS